MALTNFNLLTTEQKTVWAMDFWKQARNHSFINTFLGEGPNSLVQHITSLTKSEKGARAVITLLADLTGDGVAGDRTLEGNEEALRTYDQVIRIDQLRHANRSTGRLADQKSVVDFRKFSRDTLAYWVADRIDQLAFLTLAGWAYDYNTDGTARVGSAFTQLEFAADVAAPSTNRVAMWDVSAASPLLTGSAVSGAGGTSNLAAGDTPTWNMFLELKRYAKETYMRGVMADGEETYHAFLTPAAMAKLKQDDNFRQNVRHSAERGGANQLFTGGSVKIDGIILHEFRHVPHWSAATAAVSGTEAVAGSTVLFCGAQALAMADIGTPEWVEKDFDYDNQHGISAGKMLGFLKPKFTNQYISGSTTTEDFGVINCYVAN